MGAADTITETLYVLVDHLMANAVRLQDFAETLLIIVTLGGMFGS
jgi:hypothetical protein